MQVYRTDENGIWTGDSREIGPKDGWHRNEIRHAPPALSEGQFAQWRGHVWVVLDRYPVEPIKRDMTARLASRRWQAETGGMTFNGAPVATDDRSKALIYGARGRSVKFKTASGEFVLFSASEMEALADAVADHVRACFDHEADLLDAINAAETVKELEAVDINAGWPE